MVPIVRELVHVLSFAGTTLLWGGALIALLTTVRVVRGPAVVPGWGVPVPTAGPVRFDAPGGGVEPVEADDAAETPETVEEFLRASMDLITADAVSLCLAIGVPRHDADDVLQDALLVLHRRWPEIRDLPCTPRAWFYGVLRLTAKERRRGRRRTDRFHRALVPLPDDLDRWWGEAPEVTAPGESRDLVRLRRALGALPTLQREAVVHVHMRGLSYGETAELMQRTETAVSSLVSRAKKRLLTELDRNEGGPR